MNIQIIVMKDNFLHISSKRWHDPIYALNESNKVCTHMYGTYCNCSATAGSYWRWLGNQSWYAYAFNKVIFDALLAQLPDILNMSNGEYIECDIDINIE